MSTTIDPIEHAKLLLRRDSFENYSDAEAAAESVVTELEVIYDTLITPEVAGKIGELCEEWFASEA